MSYGASFIQWQIMTFIINNKTESKVEHRVDAPFFKSTFNNC